MGAKFTPGPWELKQFGGPQISGPQGYAVCTMWGALSVDELAGQDAANARLIAAAPELLEAVQRARRHAGNIGITGGSYIAQLDAAIAKATGGAA